MDCAASLPMELCAVCQGRSDYLEQADETLEMLIEKDNAAMEGFHRWTVDGVAR